MKKYDIIVIGSGCGLLIVEAAAAKGWKTALIEKGKLGGTCLNVGCIPSKMLIHPADVIYEIGNVKQLGIDASINGVNFKSIIDRTLFTIKGYRNKLHRQLHRLNGVDLYENTARFTSDYVIDVAGETVTSSRIIIACGARPVMPDESLIGKEGILTNDNLLDLQEAPERLIIVGGGYIACEYAHFFASMGSQVILIEMADRLLTGEEPEVSELVERTLSNIAEIRTNTRLDGIKETDSGWEVSAVSVENGTLKKFKGTHVLFAIGRKPNTDWLGLENTSIKTDINGYIPVDHFLSTNLEGVYAIGDVNGVQMFRHAANYEAEIAWHNAAHSNNKQGERAAVDYSAMPRAIFTRPQVAAVGMTQTEAEKLYPAITKKVFYYETAKGEAMQEKHGFVKTITNPENGRILGCHIAGPQASVLIQEVVNAMAGDGTVDSIFGGVHIHPALSEVIPLSFTG